MRGKLGLLALATAMACQPAPVTMSDAQKAALADSVKAFAMGMVDKMNKGDMKGAMASYSQDAGARYTNNGMMMDAAGMAKMNQDMAPMMAGMQIKPDKADVIILGPDAAVINSPYSMTMKSPAGKTVSGKGVWTGVVQRQAGAWRVVSSHISDVNAEDMMKAMMAPAPKGKAAAKAPAKKSATKKK
jgi:ketosteroid isomerase-like protein